MKFTTIAVMALLGFVTATDMGADMGAPAGVTVQRCAYAIRNAKRMEELNKKIAILKKDMTDAEIEAEKKTLALLRQEKDNLWKAKNEVMAKLNLNAKEY